MCVIMTFAPGARMNKEQFFNAVYNNWHGYGLILKDSNGHMQVIKKFDEAGTNPEEVYQLLLANEDIERFLHVRHSTKGATDDSNVHPFCAYHSSTREVYFSHNGTLNGFGNYTSGKSDTLEFVEQVLQPTLLSWVGPQGKADYTDPVYQKVIVKSNWTGGSMGLFVSNDLPPERIGAGWSSYNHPSNAEDSFGEIFVSNTTYFNKVQRGPRFLELEAIRKAEEAELRARQADANRRSVEEAKTSYTSSGTSLIKSEEDEVAGLWGDVDDYYTVNSHKVKKFDDARVAKDPGVLKAMRVILDQFALDDMESIRNLASISYEEWMDWLEDDQENGMWCTAALIDHLTLKIRELFVENGKLKEKNQKATVRLREITLEKKNDERQVG